MPLRDAAGYTIDRETYRQTDPRLLVAEQDIQVEIGDSDDGSRFRPVMQVKRWGGAAGFALGLRNPLNAEEVLNVERSREITWQIPGLGGRWFDLGPRHASLNSDPDGTGGMEFEIVLPVKPASPTVTLDLRKRNCRFEYQAPGSPFGTQPENVRGSYAVYAIEGRHNRFRNGKICHIYRPVAVDALGARAVCAFSTDADTSNELFITMPLDFYNSATYPVTIDPTFGHSSAGASSFSQLAVNITIVMATDTGTNDDSSGTLNPNHVTTQLHIFMDTVANSGTNEVKMGIYEAPGAAPDSGDLRIGAVSAAHAVTATGGAAQQDLTHQIFLPRGGSYVTAVVMQNSVDNELNIYFDTTTADNHHNLTFGGGFTLPADGSGFNVTGGAARISMWTTFEKRRVHVT